EDRAGDLPHRAATPSGERSGGERPRRSVQVVSVVARSSIGLRPSANYDSGDWTEKKVTPDKWESATRSRSAAPAKRRSFGRTGRRYVPLVHPEPLDRDEARREHDTDMAGLKYKLAHKRADKETWSASGAAQRKRLIHVLQEMIASLQKESGATPM